MSQTMHFPPNPIGSPPYHNPTHFHQPYIAPPKLHLASFNSSDPLDWLFHVE